MLILLLLLLKLLILLLKGLLLVQLVLLLRVLNLLAVVGLVLSVIATLDVFVAAVVGGVCIDLLSLVFKFLGRAISLAISEQEVFFVVVYRGLTLRHADHLLLLGLLLRVLDQILLGLREI